MPTSLGVYVGIINRLALVLSVSLLAPVSALAYLSNEKTPVCMNGSEEVRVDNAQVLKWKTTTKNQYLDRGYVSGTVSIAPTMKNGHSHFFMKIGPGPKDDLEIVYNIEFGTMPSVKVGDPLIVCGDYITSNAPTERYEASPAGAIIHWVHYNPGTRQSSKKHPHGFIQFGSTLVGFDQAPIGAWTGKIGGGRGTIEGNNGGNNGGNEPRATSQPQSSRPRVTPSPTPAPQTQPTTPGRVTPSSNPPSRNNNNPQPGSRRWVNCRSVEECRLRNPGYENESNAS